MRDSEHAPGGPYRLLQRRHGLAEIIERGTVVLVERLRVHKPQPERERIILIEDASRDGCAEIDWAPARSCDLGVPAERLRTVNVLRLTEGNIPNVLREIYERTKRVFEIAGQCHSRSGLVNYMNLAPFAARVQTPSRRRRGAHGHRTGTPSTRSSCPSA